MLKIRGKEIHISRGDDAVISLNLTQNGEPYVMEEGDEIVFRTNTEPTLEKHITNVGGTSVSLILNSEETANVPFGFYLYELQINFGNGTQAMLVPPSVFEVMDVMPYGTAE